MAFFAFLGLGALLWLGLNSQGDGSNAATLLEGDTEHKGKPKKPDPKKPDPKKPNAKALQQAAALALRKYLDNGGSFGNKAKPSTFVKDQQTAMGDLVADGIVGDKTRARAKALGQSLPARPKAAPKLVTTTKAPGLLPSDQAPPSPSPPLLPSDVSKPKPPIATPATTSSAPQKAAAAALAAHMRKIGSNWGSKAKPDPTVKAQQRAMGGLVADGIVGPNTRKRSALLGVALPTQHTPALPAAKPATVAPAPATQTQPAAAAPKAATSPKPSPKPAAAVAVPTAAQSAARALDAYVTSGGRDRARIAAWQWALGLDADGIPGASTRAAVQVQIGASTKWAPLAESAMSGPVPGGASAREAAERLERYRTKFNGSRKERIQAYQRALGFTGQAVDGVIGAKTRDAASKALGRKVAF